MTDDSKVMKAKGLKGVPGTRHWRVERDVRRRTSLPSAGGYLGTGQPLLGTAAEDAHGLHARPKQAWDAPHR